MKRHNGAHSPEAEDLDDNSPIPVSQTAAKGTTRTPSCIKHLDASKPGSKTAGLPRFKSREVERGNGIPKQVVRFCSLEKALLGALFSLAMFCGFIASNRLWEVQLAETGTGATYHVPHSQQEGPAEADGGVIRDDADVNPITRQQYLRYFRPLFEGDRSVNQAGDKAADGFVHQLLRTDSGIKSDVHKTQDPEEELWTEERYVGEKDAQPKKNPNAAALSRIEATLDKLLAKYTAAAKERAASATAKRAFAELPTASLSIDSPGHICPEVARERNEPFHPKRRALFVLGAQKCGTTFLFSALSKHPAFIGASHAYGQRPSRWAKEVHFYNRWPQPQSPKRNFLKCYPKSTWAWSDDTQTSLNYTLIDGTPEYLFNSMVPPRLKQMWPQARFIVLLRDPVMRTYSAWKMTMRMYCKLQARHAPQQPCDFPSFAELVLEEYHALSKNSCFFASEVRHPKTWADCFRCSFSFIDDELCTGPPDSQPSPCSASPFLTLSVGDYAAQLAWWFAFFPPESFKIILSYDLHHAPRLPLLNSIRDFAGLQGTPAFTDEMLRGVWGYEGGYNLDELSAHDIKAMRFLRALYSKMNEDLASMLRGTDAHADFAGIPDEIDLDALEPGAGTEAR